MWSYTNMLIYFCTTAEIAKWKWGIFSGIGAIHSDKITHLDLYFFLIIASNSQVRGLNFNFPILFGLSTHESGCSSIKNIDRLF